MIRLTAKAKKRLLRNLVFDIPFVGLILLSEYLQKNNYAAGPAHLLFWTKISLLFGIVTIIVQWVTEWKRKRESQNLPLPNTTQ